MMKTEFVDLDFGWLAYDDTGGPGGLVLCVPAPGDLRSSFRHLRPLLVAAGYRVVTADLRGHGDSFAGWSDYSQSAVGSDVVTLLRHLDAGPAVLVGNSYAGGAIACAAAEAPELVAGLVPIGGFLRAVPAGPVTRALVRATARWPRAWSMRYKAAHRAAPPEDLGRHCTRLVRSLREPGRREAMAAMLLSPAADAAPKVAAAARPALVLMGSRDPDFKDPAAEAAWQAAALGGSSVLIDRAGHYPQSEVPERTAAALLPFLAQLFPAPAHVLPVSRTPELEGNASPAAA